MWFSLWHNPFFGFPKGGWISIECFLFCFVCRIARNSIARFECSISEFQGFMYSLCCWSKCYRVLNWFFLQNRNHVKINISCILNPNLTKKIPLNPAHQDLSNNTKGTFQFLWNFQLQFNLIEFSVKKSFDIQELLHRKSKCHETKPIHPSSSSSRAFQLRMRSEPSPFSGSHNYKTKQNKLPSFIDRCSLDGNPTIGFFSTCYIMGKWPRWLLGFRYIYA